MSGHLWARAVIVAMSVYAAAGVLSVAGGVTWPQVAWVTVAASAGAVAAAAIRQALPLLAGYAAASVASAGGWLAYAVATSPWTSAAATWWAVATALLTPGYPAIVAHRARLQRQAEQLAEEAVLRRRQGAWVALWSRVGVKGLTQTGQEVTRAGLKLYMDLPHDGRVKLGDMERAAPAVEVAHGALRRGAIHVEEGPLAHEVIVHVNVIDVLGETIPVPTDTTPRSGADPFPIGQHEDGEETPLSLDKHVMVAAITGAGKSNLLNVIIKSCGQLVDTLIWVIDPKGGRLAAVWLEAWMAERCDRPVIDWVATTPAEWDAMLDAAERIRQARSNARVGGEKVQATPLCPRILIIADEVADVTAHRATLAKLRKLVQKGRSEEIKLVLVGTRGTVTVFGDGDLKSQLGTRIGLGVAQSSDAAQIFPDDPTVARSLPRMQHPGCMYVKAGPDSRAMPSKAYRIEYSQIPGLAAELADLRPGLDQLSLQAAGAPYAGRWDWDRCGHLLTPKAAAPAPARTAPAAEAPPGGGHDSFEAIVGGLGQPVPPIILAMEEIFEAAGADRLHTKVILDGLPRADGQPLTPKRLSMLLGPLGVHSVEAWEEPDGTRARGYLRADLEQARRRIDGGLRVPAAVYAWPAAAPANP